MTITHTTTAISNASASEALISSLAVKIEVTLFTHEENEGRHRGGHRTSLGHRGTVAGLIARPYNNGQWTVCLASGEGTVTIRRGVAAVAASGNLRERIIRACALAQATGDNYWVDADSLACGGGK
jgi:hypothetical protein